MSCKINVELKLLNAQYFAKSMSGLYILVMTYCTADEMKNEVHVVLNRAWKLKLSASCSSCICHALQVASLQAELAMVQSANRQAAAAAALVHQHHHQNLQQQQLLQQTAGAGPQIQLSPSAAGMMQLAGQLQHEAKAGAAHELMSPAINLCNISIMSGSSAAHGNTYASPRVKEENNSAMQQARQYVDNCNMGMSINPASSSHRLPDHSNLHKFRRIRHDDEPINLMNPTVLVHELHHRQQTSSHDDQAGAGGTGGDHLSQTLASILPRK